MINEELRGAREAAGFPTMAAAANAAKIPYRTWQDWELGNRRAPGIAFEWLKLYTKTRP
jgi:hypothetical protein